MKKAISIPELLNVVKMDFKNIEFTHALTSDFGWVKPVMNPEDFEYIVYLGKCDQDGHMFAGYLGTISIYKGNIKPLL